MILLLLEKIAASGNKELIIILDAWKTIECKKVRTKIQEVIDPLEKVEEKPKREDQEVISFSANKQWLSILENIRRQLERNVWCSFCCDVVKIERYTVKDFSHGIVLEGKCQNCGNDVARVID